MDYFRQLKGQPQAVELLQQAISKNRVATAYLFVGPFGVGRSLGAKCFSEALLCVDLVPERQELVAKRITQGNHPDLLWVEPTYQHQGQLITVQEAIKLGIKRKTLPQIRIEQIREITRFLNRPPLEASRSLVIIESAQSMTEAAANGLLKTLEEPGKATLILIAPNVDNLLSTLVSRCQKIPFYRLSKEDLIAVLNEQKQEEISKNLEILDLAQGSPGEAIAIAEKLQSIPQEILHQSKQLPRSILEGFDLAKNVSQTLDSETQLWLINYLQYFYWKQLQNKKLLERLEKAKKHLLSYVQSRLVWECLLIEIIRHQKSF
ncbi:MAG TPA: DNA polymerase III subunit delta' [Cyanothece sp. UBA12306]|nr:DNA polymerase III subunit delta' [Cyanothece sp. UBA12306]